MSLGRSLHRLRPVRKCCRRIRAKRKDIDNKIVLPGGTKDSLKMLPEFKYAAK